MAGWVYGAALAGLAATVATSAAAQDAWYVQGDFAPRERVAMVIANDLDEDRLGVPVVVRRDQLPMLADIQELTVTLVDPAGTPRLEPSPELLAKDRTSGGARPMAARWTISSTTWIATASGTNCSSSSI